MYPFTKKIELKNVSLYEIYLTHLHKNTNLLMEGMKTKNKKKTSREKKSKTMCEAALQNYASFINNHEDVTSDSIPTILFFGNTNCTSTIFPVNPQNASFTNYDYPIGANFILPNSVVPVKSFYIPFNVAEVIFLGQNNASSIFTGPILVADTNLINWQNGPINQSMLQVPIVSIEIVSMRNWNESVLNMCMGQQHGIGSNALSRYYPISQRCDYFMEQQFCINDTLTSDPACGCFADLVQVKVMSAELGVDLPVLCFGKTCALERTYKSNSILSKPCNMTICQQLLQFSDGVITGDAKAELICSGHFFDNVSNLSIPTPTPIADYTQATGPSDSPYFIGIMIAISIVLFALLAFLMFTNTKKKKPEQKPIVQQVQPNVESTNNFDFNANLNNWEF